MTPKWSQNGAKIGPKYRKKGSKHQRKGLQMQTGFATSKNKVASAKQGSPGFATLYQMQTGFAISKI